MMLANWSAIGRFTGLGVSGAFTVRGRSAIGGGGGSVTVTRTLAEWLNRDTNRTIVFKVEGNCDPRGTSEYNLGLGDRRARAVKDFLVSLGVDPSRIETVSFGSEKASGKDEGEAGVVGTWANDRRADFVYLRGGEKP